MRLQYTLVFLLLTALAYGQKSTLYQNVNVRAKELKHNLNEAGDTLVIKCERTVYEVVVFNDDFERVIKVRDTDAKIPIADIPVGRYIVEALLSDKLIVMTLIRNESFDLPKPDATITDSSDLFGMKKDVVASAAKPIEPKKALELPAITEAELEEEIFDEDGELKKTDLALAGKKTTPEPEVTSEEIPEPEPEVKKQRLTRPVKYTKPVAKVTPKRTSRQVETARANRIVSTYWVEYKINNGQSSQKIQKLGDQETVERMIKKIEIDKKTKAGRLNELIVWTVFDPPKFVKHKKNNKTNFTEVADESFNKEPYYKKVNDPDNL